MFHSNVLDYINKYGNMSFEEKEFNEIDNIVFSALTYLNYTETDINLIKKPTIEIIGKQYLGMYKYREIAKLGFSFKGAYKILEKIVNTKRYKDIVVDDYVYNNYNMQFSALTFKISKKLIYISFEGTDQYISSWRESFNMISSFLVLAHYEAIKYAKKHIKLFGPKVIIGGHSKGGNLALVSSIYLKRYQQLKIKKIYNNDGPGLRIQEYNSKKYKRIKNKYIHIIPNNSIIGLLLRSDNDYVIKSKSISFFSHSMTTWCLKDDKLIESTLSKKHHHLKQRIQNWVDTHDDIERKKTIDNIFNTLEKCDIEDTMTLMKLKSIIKIIKELKYVDDDSKSITVDFLEYSFLNKNSN